MLESEKHQLRTQTKEA